MLSILSRNELGQSYDLGRARLGLRQKSLVYMGTSLTRKCHPLGPYTRGRGAYGGPRRGCVLSPARYPCSHEDIGVVQHDRARLKHLEYRGTSLIRNTPLVDPYSRTMPRVLGGS